MFQSGGGKRPAIDQYCSVWKRLQIISILENQSVFGFQSTSNGVEAHSFRKTKRISPCNAHLIRYIRKRSKREGSLVFPLEANSISANG